jgi:hypothetical protein
MPGAGLVAAAALAALGLGLADSTLRSALSQVAGSAPSGMKAATVSAVKDLADSRPVTDLMAARTSRGLKGL